MPTPRPPVPAGLVLEPFRALRFTDGGLHSIKSLTGPDTAGGHTYNSAGAQLRQWVREGLLRLDGLPGLYAYDLALAGGQQVRGLFGAVRLAPASAGIVLPHEDTMAGPVADRLALLDATSTDLEPIFLLYDGGPAAAAALDAALSRRALLDVTTTDGTHHRLGVLEPESLVSIAAELLGRSALIADGHHRYATYLARQAQFWSRGSGPGSWDAGLAFLVDAGRVAPEVQPIHRVIPGLPFSTAVARAAEAGRVRPLPSGSAASMLTALHELTVPDQVGNGPAFILASGSEGVLLDELDPILVAGAEESSRGPAWRSLDVTALHHYVIPDVFGITDDDQTVRSESDPECALATAGSVGGTAILLRAAPIRAILSVAANGDRLPRKSTLFVPKPASGIVLRPLDVTSTAG